ncbi:MAG: hypothetical protein JO316_18225 [Abitibacteriaceae bacterium]|nr:hypothetical protein [Abditibacteriaceae bacterium]MBV9867297.1 hypothetical protein [Abditibacteriaceae bacterium]
MSSSPTNILFIGNSYTGRNDLPKLLTQLGASAPKPKQIVTHAIIANGMPLRAHWNKGEAVKAMDELPWDYVVLQEQSTLPLKNAARMHESVRLFDAEIKKRKARTVLYLTWARQDAPERQEQLTQAYTSIAEALGAIVAPVGISWQMALQEKPQLSLHEDDKSHPTILGSYLAACVFYAALFHESPVGLWSAVPDLKEEDARLVQRIAWQAVKSIVEVKGE